MTGSIQTVPGLSKRFLGYRPCCLFRHTLSLSCTGQDAEKMFRPQAHSVQANTGEPGPADSLPGHRALHHKKESEHPQNLASSLWQGPRLRLMPAQQAVPLQHSPAQEAGSATGPACRRQIRQKSETVFRKFAPCDPGQRAEDRPVRNPKQCFGNSCRADRRASRHFRVPDRRTAAQEQSATPQPAEDAPVLWGQAGQAVLCLKLSDMAQAPVAPAEDKAAARTNGQDRKGAMRKGQDTAAQDDGAGDHAYLAFQGLLATACHGKAGFFPCFPAAFQSMGRVPGRLVRKQRVVPCPVARSAGEDEGPGGFGKLNDAHSRQGRSTMPSHALLPFRRVHGHQSAVPAARFVCLWRSHVTGSHRLDPLERTKN